MANTNTSEHYVREHRENIALNQTIETMLNHRSIRKFTDEPISTEMLNAVLESGRAVSTSNYMQSVSVVRITDPEQRIKFHQISNGMSEEEYNEAKEKGEKLAHPYILECPEYLVFCMDNARHNVVSSDLQLDWMEVVIISAVDAGLFAQNVMVAAESLGLGGVYIGSMRNDIARAGEVINAPKHVVPLFGMCLGHPKKDAPINANQKPRLPLSVMVSENHYQSASKQTLQDFDDEVMDYYKTRGSKDHADWTKQVQKVFGKPVRPQVLPYLNEQGYAKR